MRLVIQRASHASVTIDGQVKSQIGYGLVILVGICEEDTEEDIDWLVRKVTMLRVFDDENGVMNRSIMDVGGEIMVVSQFTLYASYKKASDPSGSVSLCLCHGFLFPSSFSSNKKTGRCPFATIL